MTISIQIDEIMQGSSSIRRMFEKGIALKKLFDDVCDFSLGNPNSVPPAEFHNALDRIVKNKKQLSHSYMPNAGYDFVRKSLAKHLAKQQRVRLKAADIIMTVGAAGALNVVLKCILDRNDEVICITPAFSEYQFYIQNHGGKQKRVPSLPDFNLDIPAIAKAVTRKTRAVIINSPNNPTGRIYDQQTLKALGKMLKLKSKKHGKIIYLISDEPYRNFVYTDQAIPNVFTCYPHTFIVNSSSKELSIPGERIGYLAINPKTPHREALQKAASVANRILGYVNAPALMQRVFIETLGIHVKSDFYLAKRELLCDILERAGFQVIRPDGAFYLFLKVPFGLDDTLMTQICEDSHILVVPGRAFGCENHVRIAYCVSDTDIKMSEPGWKQVFQRLFVCHVALQVMKLK